MAAPQINAAARWLSENEFAAGGWGYNEAVGADADSTSCAILFLASAGQPPAPAAYAFLAKLQCADAGFSTYLPFGPPNSWNVSHPDVTPMALRAMLTHPAPDRGAIRRGIEYVLRQRRATGLWDSFWWASCLYGTAASLSLLNAAGIEMPPSTALSRLEPANAFEAGLLISSLLYADRDGSHVLLGELVDKLVSRQQTDGSWNTGPILRVTRRDCYEPWACDDAGPLYAEPNRLFTTATALHALARVTWLD